MTFGDRNRAPASSDALTRLGSGATFELVPLKSLDDQAALLPRGSRVSVTCSPAKGFDATLDAVRRLVSAGLEVTPHLAARTVRDRSHLGDLVAAMNEIGTTELFVIGGDSPDPAGDYFDAAALLADLFELEHRLVSVGIAGYPDGHLSIDESALRSSLHDKQALIRSAGIDGWVSTQMCFDASQIVTWLSAERAAGLTLPVRLGIPGPVERTKLVTMGLRVGVGQSLRYLQKNGGGLLRLLGGSTYDPSRLINDLARSVDHFGITGLHLFTFNQVGAALEWQQRTAA